MSEGINRIWKSFFNLNWKFGLLLVLLICIPRFILVLKANQTNNYSLIGLIMLISALIPFVFLNKYGLKQIGIQKPKSPITLVYALLLGIIVSLIIYYLGVCLYDNTLQNWYQYIGLSYNIPEDITNKDRHVMFVIMAVTGMTFSPIGEELFFRGIVHHSFANSLGNSKASLIDGLAFALTHISHFGLIFVANRWDFYFIPTLIWVISMFAVSLLFIGMKRKSKSIWGAVLCHSGFNLGMIFSIFYLL